MPKIETASKVSINFLSRIDFGRRGGRARIEFSMLDSAHKFLLRGERVIPRFKRIHIYHRS